jgi:hypothetical protein
VQQDNQRAISRASLDSMQADAVGFNKQIFNDVI